MIGSVSEKLMHPISVLLASGEYRVRKLLPVKYGRMKQSPFAFFRGAVPIMAADLARLPNPGLHVQLCGVPTSRIWDHLRLRMANWSST